MDNNAKIGAAAAGGAAAGLVIAGPLGAGVGATLAGGAAAAWTSRGDSEPVGDGQTPSTDHGE